jgi:hypothetical protein
MGADPAVGVAAPSASTGAQPHSPGGEWSVEHSAGLDWFRAGSPDWTGAAAAFDPALLPALADGLHGALPAGIDWFGAGSIDPVQAAQPFDWFGAGSMHPMHAVQPFDGGFHGPIGGSPADTWLSGNEWHGHITSGTIDPTGHGNSVFAVDGHVLDLPPH